MKIVEKIEINGKYYPHERDMTEEERKYLENIDNNIDQETEPQTDTERIEKLEEAIQLLLSGGTE